MTFAIQTSSLVKKYNEVPALDGVSLSVGTGELFALLGPNGSGKSTLFRILSTLIPPDDGTAQVAGCDVVKQAAAVREKIGVVFQSPSLDKKLTARENLVYGGALYGLSGGLLRDRIETVSKALRITEMLGKLVETLSGGQQRRVEIAKCLLTQPAVLLLDEPSTGLDPSARIDLWSFVDALRAERGITVFFTTHLMDEAARADRVAVLAAGHLVAEAKPAELLKEIEGDMVRIVTRTPDRVTEILKRDYGLISNALDGEVRVAAPDAHALAAKITAALGGDVDAITVSRPSLEDVFIKKTGSRLNE